MNGLLLIAIFGLWLTYRHVYLVVGHRRHLRTYEAVYRIFRWCIVVGVAWLLVALAMHGLSEINFAEVFTVNSDSKLTPQ